MSSPLGSPQLCDALDYAHNHAKVIHRDLKPSNLMLNKRGDLKITDFGIARSLADSASRLTGEQGRSGTLVYMSPQQLSGERGTHLDDIYSLGATIYELFTSKPPFYSGNIDRQIREKDPPSMTRRREELEIEAEPIPAVWEEWVAACLAKDPRQRPQSVTEIARQLEMPSRERTAKALPKSIAVLPFENLSRDPDNAYFAQGIQQEILTRLTNIADLRVISRTSTQQYQSKPGNLSEIAKQLGVTNILEGSVQKVADQVRVNAQLINAQTDSHLWAETYDRKLTDIFGVESEIAKGIAQSLQAKLTGHEEQALAVKPTNNPEAYDAYLRGLAFEARSTYSVDAPMKAVDSYERAVQLDPNFALAWARLSVAHAFVYFIPLDAAAARRDAAKRALENAQKLQPNSPETLLALGYYQYCVLRDYGLAKSTFALVSKMLPGSSEVPKALGYIARRLGQWDESVAYFEQALALDPRNAQLLHEAAGTYIMLRQFPAALKLHDRTLDITPNDPARMAEKAGTYQAEGNLQEAAKLLSETNAQTLSAIAFLIKMTEFRLERNLGEAIRLLQARLAQFRYASEIEKINNQLWLALTQRLNGDTAGAKVTAAQARSMLESFCKNQPDNALLVAALSMANAVLGEKELALKEAERAITLSPSIKDQVRGPACEEILAVVETMVGENSRAISTLARLLQTPYSSWLYIGAVTASLLRLDPLWDPLRGDPRFQKLCEEKQP